MKQVAIEGGGAMATRVREASSAPATTWLFVHGWMTDGRVHDQLVARVDRADRRLVMPDLRGFGASGPRPEQSLQGHADDLWALADALELERLVWVGHSMGGQIAQLAAAQHPERVEALLLINPVPLAGLALPAEVRPLFESAGGDRDKLAAILDMACLALASRDREVLLDAALTASGPVLRQSLDAWSAGADPDVAGRIAAPTTVVASDDPFLPAQLLDVEVRQRIEGARLLTVEGAGHYPLVERSAETASALESAWR